MDNLNQELMHPTYVAGRQLWIDPAMQAIIDKIRFGDTIRGWEGDEALAVFWNADLSCFELMRAENGDYSLVARLKSGGVFDERIIDELVARDMRRNPKRDLHAEIEASNEAARAADRKALDEMTREEVAPRLRRSMMKEGWI